MDYRLVYWLEMSTIMKSLKGSHSSLSRLNDSYRNSPAPPTVQVRSSIDTPEKRPSTSTVRRPVGEAYSQVDTLESLPQLPPGFRALPSVR